jgi:hypothetical protein
MTRDALQREIIAFTTHQQDIVLVTHDIDEAAASRPHSLLDRGRVFRSVLPGKFCPVREWFVADFVRRSDIGIAAPPVHGGHLPGRRRHSSPPSPQASLREACRPSSLVGDGSRSSTNMDGRRARALADLSRVRP